MPVVNGPPVNIIDFPTGHVLMITKSHMLFNMRMTARAEIDKWFIEEKINGGFVDYDDLAIHVWLTSEQLLVFKLRWL